MSGPVAQVYRLVEALIARRTGVDIAGHLAGRVQAHVDGQVARHGRARHGLAILVPQ